MPTALIIYQGSKGFGNEKALQTVNIFHSRAEADEAFTKVLKAATAWNERTNEREQFVTIECVNGPTAIDASTVLCLGVDDALEKKARTALEEWGIAVGEIRGKQLAAEKSFTNSQPRDD